MPDSSASADELDRLFDAPPAERGPLHRFGQITLAVRKRAFEPDPDTGRQRKVDFDETIHHPDQARDAIVITITPLDPRFQAIEREVLVPSREFDLTRASLRALNRTLSEIDGRYGHVAWEPNEAVLGTHLGRDGQRRPSMAMLAKAIYDDETSCRAAAEAFFVRGRSTASLDGGVGVASTTPTAPAPSAHSKDPTQGAAGWTDDERAERATLLTFLPAIAQGKDYAGFVAALAADERLARYFMPTDPDVVDVLVRLGLVPAAPVA